MQGQLGKTLFADLIQSLSRENATGRLRITRGGDTIEVFFDSGVPMAATSTLPDEQIECRLVRDGLVDTEQIKTAWLAASESPRGIDAVLVENGALTAETLQQTQNALSLGIINTAFEWYTGDYEFIAEPDPPPGPKLTWTIDECILSGARHASSKDTILDVIASDYKTVGPAPRSASSMEHSATLSSVEGYVLSCIQSPVTIWEASSMTGLSHIETQRALFVLIMLGLLIEQKSPSDQGATEQQLPADHIPAEQQTPAVQWCPVEYVSRDNSMQQDNCGPAEYHAPSELEEGAGGEVQLQDEYSNPARYDLQNEYQDQAESAAAAAPAEGPEETIPEEITVTSMGDSTAIPEGGCEAREDERNDGDQFALVSPPIAVDSIDDTVAETLTSEEAVYQQRLFLEERLQEAPGDRDCAVVDQSKNGNLKSLTTAIQELNIRLRLAASSIPDQPCTPDNQAPVEENGAAFIEESPAVEELLRPGERLRVREGLRAEAALAPEAELRSDPDVGAEQWPALEESHMLQGPPTFEEPLRIGPQPGAEGPLPHIEASLPPVEAPPCAEETRGPEQVIQEPMSVPEQTSASLPRRDNGGDERFLKKIIGKLDARLANAASSDYYQLLGVDRLASNGNITKSFEEIVALYDGYKARWPEDRELESKTTELIDKIGRAYETIGNVERRRVYDMPPAKEEPQPSRKKDFKPVQEPVSQPILGQEPVAADTGSGSEIRKPRPDRKKPVPLPVSGLTGKTRRPTDTPRDGDGPEPDLRNPYEAAEEYYKRGRALYERSDLHTAAHLLREAIKLDANRSSYHYQLGLVLSTLSQARKEHKHHKGCHVTCRLGGLLARNQRVRREAERHLLMAAELDPSNPEIKLKLGLLYKDAALDQKSQQYFHEALMLDASSELARLELGLDREPQINKSIAPVKRRSKPRSRRT